MVGSLLPATITHSEISTKASEQKKDEKLHKGLSKKAIFGAIGVLGTLVGIIVLPPYVITKYARHQLNQFRNNINNATLPDFLYMVGIDKTIFYNFIKDYQIPLAQFKLIDNSSDENIKIAAKATIPLDTLKENARNLWQDKKKVEAINDRLKAGKNHQYFTTFIHWPEDKNEIQFSIILDSNIYLNMMR